MRIFSVLIVMSLSAHFANAQWQIMNGPAPPAISLLTNGTDVFAGCGNLSAATGVHRSSDNGLNWMPATNDGLVYDVLSLTKNDTYIFATQGNSVYATSNNGENWTSVSSGLPAFNINALAASGETIFAATMDLYATTDNGLSWNMVTPNYLYNTLSLAIKGDTIFAGTQNNGVYLSTDNGLNWDGGYNGLPQTMILALTIQGSTILAGTNGGIYLSTDMGASWTLSDLTVRINSFVIVGSNIFAGGIYDGIFLSTDNGENWESINDGLAVNQVSDLAVNDEYIFAGVLESYVHRRPLSDFINTGISNTENISDIVVFPNPSTEKFTVTLPGISKETRVTLYNSSGQKAVSATYFNTNRIEFNVNGLAGGLYFARIETDDGSFHKKVLLE